jgi:U3 small nucleolar RNA-associated protein 18
MLAMFSKWKKDAVKILHMQSLTVFANWPSFRDHVKYPMACGFNATSELLTVGNDEGAALLYRLNHYTQ